MTRRRLLPPFSSARARATGFVRRSHPAVVVMAVVSEAGPEGAGVAGFQDPEVENVYGRS